VVAVTVLINYWKMNCTNIDTDLSSVCSTTAWW